MTRRSTSLTVGTFFCSNTTQDQANTATAHQAHALPIGETWVRVCRAPTPIVYRLTWVHVGLARFWAKQGRPWPQSPRRHTHGQAHLKSERGLDPRSPVPPSSPRLDSLCTHVNASGTFNHGCLATTTAIDRVRHQVFRSPMTLHFVFVLDSHFHR
jgi:hypothetical protein